MANRLSRRLRGRRVTNAIRYVLDDWLPPAVRELRLLNRLMANVFHGPEFDLDFKERAFSMSPEEIARAYERLAAGGERYRETDTTDAQADAILAETIGRTVLEVGCGNGVLTEKLAARGFEVVASDVGEHSLEATADRLSNSGLHCEVALGGLPALPFADNSFDTVVCAHTLEHIPDLYQAARDLRRVARERLVVVVPRQRYYRYTIDYHLHFFPSAAPLASLLGGRVTDVDGDWLIVADLSPGTSTP